MSQFRSQPSVLVTPFAALLAGIALVALTGLLARPFAFPVDETRYLAVAWEMWWKDDFVLPWINGHPYDHKPPLLFWLIHLGWSVFGVNDWWPRLIGPLALVGAAFALRRLGQRLYPQQAQAGAYAALLLVSTTYLAIYQTGIMFDALLLATLCLAWLGLHAAVVGGRWRDWGLFALGGALGMLTKGPVTLLYVLPALLFVRFWRPAGVPPIRVGRAVLALLCMFVPVALWALAAGLQGGDQYFHDLVIGQTAHRVQGAMGHPRPFYWYVPFLFLLGLPWLLWWPLWRALWGSWKLAARKRDAMMVWVALPALLALMLVSGKQVHYLIPIFAALALPVAAALLRHEVQATRWQMIPPALLSGVVFPVLILLLPTRWPGALPPGSVHWVAVAMTVVSAVAMLALGRGLASRVAPRLALANLLAVAALLMGVMPTLRGDYDLRSIAAFAAAQQAQGRTVAYVGIYQGELHFAGRLRQRVEPVSARHALVWSVEHPQAVLMMRSKRVRLLPDAKVEARTRYKRAEWLAISAQELIAGRAIVIDPSAPEAGGSGNG